MGVFDRLERGLERAVKQPFARVFKAEVQPVEIASAMRDAMDDRAAVLGPGRTMVPNVFTIQLADSDHERLASFEHALTDELVAAAEDHADAQRYVAPGPFEVRLIAGDDLETGIFRVAAAAKDGRSGRGGVSAKEYAEATPRNERLGQQHGRDEHEDNHRRDDHRRDERGRGEDDPHAAYRRPDAGAPAAAAGGAALGHGAGESRGYTREFQAPSNHRAPRGGAGRPRLEVEGRTVPLTAAVTTIGRDISANVTIEDPGVSRRHAEVRITHDGPQLQVILRDLGSTNGTYLNGEQIGSEELRNNDRITVGRTHVTFRMEG